jgi:SAM-dependent methyltransferase
MNWYGVLAQKYITKEDSVLDLGCETMQAILDWVTNKTMKRLQCKRLVGVDMYQPYLDFIKSKGVTETVKHDLRVTPYPFEDKSFDVVMATDVIEHLHEREAQNLVSEMERIANRTVIILTPSIWDANTYLDNLQSLDNLEAQKHKWLVPKEWLLNKGFNVITIPFSNAKPYFAVKSNEIKNIKFTSEYIDYYLKWRIYEVLRKL